jgi:ribose 5-phosphate isomerase RpiB
MAIENVQQLLTEQMGKNRCDVILTDNMTSKDYYAVHFPIESVILSIAADNVIEGGGSGVGNLNNKTMVAGTTIFLNVTQLQLTSGLALCYYEQPL